MTKTWQARSVAVARIPERDDVEDEHPRAGSLAVLLGAAAAVAAGLLAVTNATLAAGIGARVGIGTAAAAAGMIAAAGLLAWTARGVSRLEAARRAAEIEREGLVEEISQELDKLRERLAEIEARLPATEVTVVTRTPTASAIEAPLSVVRR